MAAVLSILAALVLGAIIGAAVTSQQDELDAAAAQLVTTQRQRDDTASKLSASEAEVSSAERKIGSLEREVDGLEDQVAVIDDRSAELDVRQRELDGRQTALDQRQAELDGRQAAIDRDRAELDQRFAAVRANSFGDGVHEVGVDIQPGKYKTDGGSRCYWQKSDRGNDIIDNDLPSGPSTVIIEASVFTFTSSNCGTWTKTG